MLPQAHSFRKNRSPNVHRYQNLPETPKTYDYGGNNENIFIQNEQTSFAPESKIPQRKYDTRMLSDFTPELPDATGPPLFFIGVSPQAQANQNNLPEDEVKYFAMVPVKMQP